MAWTGVCCWTFPTSRTAHNMTCYMPEILTLRRYSTPPALSPPYQALLQAESLKQLLQLLKVLAAEQVVPKPSKAAQTLEDQARKVALSDVFAVKKRNRFLQRSWEKTDFIYVAFMIFMHGLCLAAPFTFSWGMVALFLGTYAVTGCLGITLSYHRQLSHRSFQTPKWLEYALAYCGVLAIQGDPLEWVSSHRYHHLHTDTPLDPHSPYEGFWWSHMGWLLDNKVPHYPHASAQCSPHDRQCWPYTACQACYPATHLVRPGCTRWLAPSDLPPAIHQVADKGGTSACFETGRPAWDPVPIQSAGLITRLCSQSMM